MVTRFYFPESNAADVSPAFGAWGETGSALVRKLQNVKGSSAITIGTRHGWTAGVTQLDRQYVSRPMKAGISFSAVTVKMYLMTREYNNGDNSTSRLLVKIVNKAGDTIQQTLLALGQFGPATEYVNNVTHRNKAFADGDTVTGSYTTVEGDRIVVEIGHADAAGSTPEASCKFGENATDLPENQTQTTNGAGWIEFSNNITFGEEITWLDTFLGTDSWILTRAKSFLDTFLGTDVWNVAKTKEFFDTMLGTDLWTLTREKLFADSLLGTDTWTLTRAKQWLDSLVGTDSWIVSRAKQFLDLFSGVDVWILERTKQFNDTFLGTDLWTHVPEGGEPIIPTVDPLAGIVPFKTKLPTQIQIVPRLFQIVIIFEKTSQLFVATSPTLIKSIKPSQLQIIPKIGSVIKKSLSKVIAKISIKLSHGKFGQPYIVSTKIHKSVGAIKINAVKHHRLQVTSSFIKINTGNVLLDAILNDDEESLLSYIATHSNDSF